MPILIRAGAILPIDPIRQYTAEKTDAPLTIRVYRGAVGDYRLYEDDGESLAYLKGDFRITRFRWEDARSSLHIEAAKLPAGITARPLKIEIFPTGETRTIEFAGEAQTVAFPGQ